MDPNPRWTQVYPTHEADLALQAPNVDHYVAMGKAMSELPEKRIEQERALCSWFLQGVEHTIDAKRQMVVIHRKDLASAIRTLTAKAKLASIEETKQRIEAILSKEEE